MAYSTGEWKDGFTPAGLAEAAALWNANAGERHAFFPWTGGALHALLTENGKGMGKLFAAREDGALAGFAHAGVIDEPGYPRVGAVEMIMVDARHRGKGVGAGLLRHCVAYLEGVRPAVEFLDALGAWPFGYVFNTLADGSERSGVFLREAGLYRLFRQAGFVPVRKSLVMRAALPGPGERPAGADTFYYVDRRTDRTWLDRVFRGRELWDHYLVRNDNRILSRAIFGFMEGESHREGKAVFSLFGVNTPDEYRKRGYAGINISRMMRYLAGLGGEILEIHVYADNIPALALYQSMGFALVAETMMMHKRTT